MSSVWETQHGLLSEQLRSLVGGKHGTSELTNEQTQRLIVAAYVVLRNHEVNKQGGADTWGGQATRKVSR